MHSHAPYFGAPQSFYLEYHFPVVRLSVKKLGFSWFITLGLVRSLGFMVDWLKFVGSIFLWLQLFDFFG